MGNEELYFDPSGHAGPRSKRILDLIRSSGIDFPSEWLDYGCGNGAFLRGVSEAFPGTRLHGVEYSDINRSAVMSLADLDTFTTSLDDSPLEMVDLVSMIHVLEHLENPVAFLQCLARRMPAHGRLLIQVPNIRSNEFVVAVADHASHFDVATLPDAVTRGGFEVEWVAEDFVAGEISLMARIEPNFHFAPTSRFDLLNSERNLASHSVVVEGLLRTVAWLIQARSSSQSFGIFGTSIAGSWSAAAIACEHDFWVDENPDRIGSNWLGRPVLGPGEVPPGSLVAVTLAHSKAKHLIHRIGSQARDVRYVRPGAMAVSSERSES